MPSWHQLLDKFQDLLWSGQEMASILYHQLHTAWSLPPQDNFDQFTTVDWVADANRARLRSIRYRNFLYDGRWRFRILAWFDAAQSWLVVLLVGAAIGTSAAFIDITTGWCADLKLGYCTTHWYLTQKFCCWEQENNVGSCDDWQAWGSIGGLHQEEGVLGLTVYLLVSVILATLSAFLVKKYAPSAAGSGIPQIKAILGGFLLPSFLGKSTLLIKTIALILAASSGLSLGKEGPSVHLACCIGIMISTWFSKFRNNLSKHREILSAASAAGVAVAFGSPIGGVLYSLEELSSHFPMKTLWRSFFSALVATVILHSWNPFRTGKIVLFQVENFHSWHSFEILVFVAIGLFGGLYGVLTTRLNRWVAAFRSRHLKNYILLDTIFLTSLTALICFFNPFLKVDMSESMSILFKECDKHFSVDLCHQEQMSDALYYLIAAAVIRFLLVVITYGCEVPTGIFIPSMAIGACVGRAIGEITKGIFIENPDLWLFSTCPKGLPCIHPGTYAILGAAAALCGITRMTVSVVVIMFELTGAAEFILPTMITVIVAKAVGDAFHHGGIADQAIHWKGYPFMENEESHIGVIPVAQAMSKRPYSIPATGWKLVHLQKFLSANTFKGFPVIRGVRDPRIEGYITRADILTVLESVSRIGGVTGSAHCFFKPPSVTSVTQPSSTTSSIDFGAVLNQNPFVVHPKLSLETVLTLFKKIGPHVLLIELHGQLIGLVTKKDILHYERAIEVNHHPPPPNPSSSTANRPSPLRPRRSFTTCPPFSWFSTTASSRHPYRDLPTSPDSPGLPLTGL